MLRQHSLSRKGPAKAAGSRLSHCHKSPSTFQDYLPVCPLSPAAVHVLDRERLEDLRTKGLHAAKDTFSHAVNLLALLWLSCCIVRM